MSKVEFRPGEEHFCGHPMFMEMNRVCGEKADYCVIEGIRIWRCKLHSIAFIPKSVKEEKVEFKVEMAGEGLIRRLTCDQHSCGEAETYIFKINPNIYIYLCEEHGKHLKALVESQDKPTRNSRNSLFKELKALCNRYEPVEYCQECGNVKEDG